DFAMCVRMPPIAKLTDDEERGSAAPATQSRRPRRQAKQPARFGPVFAWRQYIYVMAEFENVATLCAEAVAITPVGVCSYNSSGLEIEDLADASLAPNAVNRPACRAHTVAVAV